MSLHTADALGHTATFMKSHNLCYHVHCGQFSLTLVALNTNPKLRILQAL